VDLHFKDTKKTIEDAKKAQDLGAIGLQVCPPIFNLPSQKDISDYFSDLSDAISIGGYGLCHSRDGLSH